MPLLARPRKLSAAVLCTAAAVASPATPSASALDEPPPPPTVGDLGVFYADHGLGNSAVLGPDGDIWSATTYFDYSAGIGPDAIEVFSPTTRDVIARYDVGGIVTSVTSGPDASSPLS